MNAPKIITSPAVQAAAKVAIGIIEALGGNQFIKMTGAHKLIPLDNGVLISLPNNLAKSGINRVKVKLMPTGLHDIRFIRSDSETYTRTDVWALGGVASDALASEFTQHTGLSLDTL